MSSFYRIERPSILLGKEFSDTFSETDCFRFLFVDTECPEVEPPIELWQMVTIAGCTTRDRLPEGNQGDIIRIERSRDFRLDWNVVGEGGFLEETLNFLNS